ncbi:uncharacterized protein [Phyllobates terribilis]|uniref:uncharacterized protein n=1 Tax=Phyllobates terribilis TaxID=111132 RepID=UPI003CCA74BC
MQLELARIKKESPSTQTRESNVASCFKPCREHFPVMEKDGDLDTFLRGFEKACRQYQLPTDQWARYLTPGLRGKALEVFASLPREQYGDYEAVKQALINKYQLTPEVYRKKFRALQRGPHDTYSDVVDGLRTNFEPWIQGLSVTTFKDLQDLMVKDQFLHLCPVEVRQFVLDREPKEAAKAAQIADTYEANRTPEVRKSAAASWKGGKPTTTPSVPASRPSAGPAPSSCTWTAFNSRKCYTCDQTGHISLVCPERQKMNPTPEAPGPTAAILFVGGVVGRARENLQPVTVGNTVTVGLKYTGAECTLIRPEFVLPEELVPGKTLTVTGFGGVRRPIPMARVFLDWGAGRGLRQVGVSENLPTNVLLGTDLGRLVARYVPDNPPRSDLSFYGTPFRERSTVDWSCSHCQFSRCASQQPGSLAMEHEDWQWLQLQSIKLRSLDEEDEHCCGLDEEDEDYFYGTPFRERSTVDWSCSHCQFSRCASQQPGSLAMEHEDWQWLQLQSIKLRSLDEEDEHCCGLDEEDEDYCGTSI